MVNPMLAGLTKRRTELVAEVKEQEGVLRGLLADIDHLDAAMRQFDPEHRARRPNTSLASVERGAGRGAVTKTILGVLRTAGEPLTLRETAMRTMMAFGMDCQDRKRTARMIEQVRTVIYRQRVNGIVVSETGPGAAGLWRVAK
jgi:hypothetical protein